MGMDVKVIRVPRRIMESVENWSDALGISWHDFVLFALIRTIEVVGFVVGGDEDGEVAGDKTEVHGATGSGCKLRADSGTDKGL